MVQASENSDRPSMGYTFIRELNISRSENMDLNYDSS